MKFSCTRRGFTLIELLVVIAIIALLSSVILASINDARTKARTQALVASTQQMINGLELYNQANGNMYPGESNPGTVAENFIYYAVTKNSNGLLEYFDNAANVGNLATLLEPYFDITSFNQHLKPGEYLIYFWDPDHKCVDQTNTPRFMILLQLTETLDNIPKLLYISENEVYPDYNCLSI